MLKSCIRAERKKLRSSAIWLLFLIVPVFPAIMGTFNYIGNLAVLKNGWYSLWTQHTLFYTDFFYAPLIAAYAAYLWRMEHLNHNWNFLMTAPVPLKDLILAKFIVLFQMTVFTQIWIGILFFVCGKLAGLPGLMPLPCIFWLFRGCIGSLGIIALSLLLSMVIRSFSVPVILALFGSIGSLGMVAKGAGYFWPYALMMLAMNANSATDNMAGTYVPFLFSAALFLFLFLETAIFLLKKKDVHSV